MYGVKDHMQNQQLSADEINKMREMVLAHDQKNAQSIVMDLSKPIIVPYTHQEYPKMVYDHAASEPGFWAAKKTVNGDDLYHVPAKLVNRIVKNADELQAALAEGFSEEAPYFEDCNTQENPHLGFGRPVVEKRKPGRPKAS